MSSAKVRLVCVSDTQKHNHAPGQGYTLPRGDILVHAGDFTNQGTFAELQRAVEWIDKAEGFEGKVVVAGNHDLGLDVGHTDDEECRSLFTSNPNIVYLQHGFAKVSIPSKSVQLRVFGSPHSPAREGKEKRWAFQYAEEDASELWSAIPADLDLLITHTPPAGFLDASKHWSEGGCAALTRAVARTRPRVHVFGHCHEGRGAMVVNGGGGDGGESLSMSTKWDDVAVGKQQSRVGLTNNARGGFALRAGEQTALVNASVMARSFGGAKAFNKPIVVDVEIPIRSSQVMMSTN